MARRSPTQLAALRAIAGGDVKIYRTGSRTPTVIDHLTATPIRIATWRALTNAGLADRDRSTSLYQGQAVHLTDAGRAELPSA